MHCCRMIVSSVIGQTYRTMIVSIVIKITYCNSPFMDNMNGKISNIGRLAICRHGHND